MNDENLHITPDPEKGFPKPDIPVDQAWNEMSRLLDTEMPPSPPENSAPHEPPSTGGSGITGFLGHYWNLILIVAGVGVAITWGVVHMTRESETLVNKTENVTEPTQVAKIDSPAPVEPQKQSPAGSYVTAETKTLPQASLGLSVDRPAEVIRAQPDSPARASETQENLSPGATQIPANPIPAADTSRYVPGGGETTKDTTRISSTPETPARDVAAPKADVNTGKEPPSSSKPAGEASPADTRQNPRSRGNRNSSGVSENLSWNVGIAAEPGAVLQTGRTPNLYYGGTVTGGLWHKKLKAGIETGIGWYMYQDYGSVTQNISVTDSVPGDSLHPVTQTDSSCTTRYTYRYQYLQVPLYITKQILSKGKFSLDLRTGPVVGFLVSESSTTDSAFVPSNGTILSTTRNDYTRLKTTWQWNLMVRFRWDFNKRLSLFLGPSMNFYLNNLYDKNNRPPKAPYGVGIYGGVRYSFR